MNPIIEGVAANGVTALASSLYSLVQREFGLTYRMRRHLHSNEVDDDQNKIHEALQRAIGNFAGLTQPTNSALLDISNSGLLGHLVSIFGSDVPPNDAKRLLKYIHLARGSSDEILSDEFATQMEKCLSVVHKEAIDQLSNQLLTNFDERRHRQRSDAAKRSAAIVSQILGELIDNDGNWINGTDVDPQNISRKIISHADPLTESVRNALQKFSAIDIHGASGDVVRVPLSEIYVDMPVSFIARERNFVQYQDLRRHLPRTEVADNWNDTLSFISKTVLLGDPGGGKSTLSKKISSEIAQKFLGGETTIPIFIQLRTYIAHASADTHLNLTRFMIEEVHSNLPDADQRTLDATILYHLRVGSAFIVADGLDEVLTSANRARVVDELQRFTKQFPLVSLLVTSRYVGYETHPLTGFTHLGVDSLKENSIKDIYRKISCAVLKKNTEESEKLLPSFFDDANKKAAELIRSPLLLTLIVIIYSKKSEIPDNRASLYGFCADLLFERWDGFRAITPDLPERYRLFDLFKHLSALLYEKEEYGGRINNEDLFNEARKFFRRDYVDNREGKSAAAAKHMVDHLTGRAWILHEVGENVFEFTHRTFLEFFYARHLDTKFESTRELVSASMEFVAKGSRTVPTHLALQIRTKDKREASTIVTDALADRISSEPNNEELADFCLDTLGYLLPDAASMLNFVAKLAPIVLALKRSGGPVKLLCNNSPMRMTILKGALPALRKVNTVEEIQAVAPALLTLNREKSGSVVPSDGEEVIIEKLVMNQNYKKQSTSPLLCKLSFDLNAETNWGALKKFGFRLWFNRGFVNQIQLIIDSRKMLQSATKYLKDADYEGERFLDLAKALSENWEQRSNGELYDRYVTGYLRSISAEMELREVALNTEDWREDKESMELYAFCLTLYLELRLEWFKASEIREIKSVYSVLNDCLTLSGSERARWHKSWLEGKREILVGKRHTRRARSFLAKV